MMGAVKMLCAATVIAVAAVQVLDGPRAKQIALWTGMNRVLGVEPGAVAKSRAVAVSGEAMPQPPARSAGTEIIAPNGDGQFNSDAEIEGQRFPVLVDTGAYMVCLTSDVADRLGYRPSPSDYRYSMGTANGPVNYAKVTLRELRLGTLSVHDVPAMIAPPGALFRSLLGMSFLTKLSGFRTDDGRLVLQQ